MKDQPIPETKIIFSCAACYSGGKYRASVYLDDNYIGLFSVSSWVPDQIISPGLHHIRYEMFESIYKEEVVHTTSILVEEGKTYYVDLSGE